MAFAGGRKETNSKFYAYSEKLLSLYSRGDGDDDDDDEAFKLMIRIDVCFNSM